MKKMFFVYIVKCSDGSLYTGWTTDPEQRIARHNEGKGAKYTAARRPVSLCYLEETLSKGEALRREYAIKQMSREEKLKLIKNYLERL